MSKQTKPQPNGPNETKGRTISAPLRPRQTQSGNSGANKGNSTGK